VANTSKVKKAKEISWFWPILWQKVGRLSKHLSLAFITALTNYPDPATLVYWPHKKIAELTNHLTNKTIKQCCRVQSNCMQKLPLHY